MSQPPVVQQDRPSRLMPMAIYLCYLGSFLTGVTAIVGIILAYMNRGTGPAWIETHYRYQIRTFWIGLFYSAVGVLTLILLVGWLVLFATSVWLILRCAQGLSWLDRGEPVPDPTTWAV